MWGDGRSRAHVSTRLGKELVARSVHESGPRLELAFTITNCAALIDDLLESELFDHARGAFTGVVARRERVLEVAVGGTVLLDEESELFARAQAAARVAGEGSAQGRRNGDGRSSRLLPQADEFLDRVDQFWRVVSDPFLEHERDVAYLVCASTGSPLMTTRLASLLSSIDPNRSASPSTRAPLSVMI